MRTKKKYLRLLCAGYLNGGGSDLDVDFGIFMTEFEGVVEDLEVLVEREGAAGQLLLLRRNEVVEPAWRVDEYELPVVLERH